MCARMCAWVRVSVCARVLLTGLSQVLSAFSRVLATSRTLTEYNMLAGASSRDRLEIVKA